MYPVYPWNFPWQEIQSEPEISVCVRQVVVWVDLCPSCSMQGLIRLTDGDNDCPRKKDREVERRSKRLERKRENRERVERQKRYSKVNISYSSIKWTSRDR